MLGKGRSGLKSKPLPFEAAAGRAVCIMQTGCHEVLKRCDAAGTITLVNNCREGSVALQIRQSPDLFFRVIRLTITDNMQMPATTLEAMASDGRRLGVHPVRLSDLHHASSPLGCVVQCLIQTSVVADGLTNHEMLVRHHLARLVPVEA